MTNPEVSVVMSVYNGAKYLWQSIESVLRQDGVDLEFIIVNDGSTDETGEILAGYAQRDKRVCSIDQENTGLTKALIRGCAEARGKYIARQDAGDLSLPGRLERQLEAINETPKAVLVSCGTRFVGPEKEILFEVQQDPDKDSSGLTTLDTKEIRGPSHHGSTMFPKKIYEKVGGYRPEFYFAQDIDLWTRLVEHGNHIIIPEILYQASYSPNSISGENKNTQVMLLEMILEGARLRRNGMNETTILEKVRCLKPDDFEYSKRLQKASSLYFIGMCLKKRGDRKARKYFVKALQAFPLHLKSVLRLIQS